MSVPHKNKFCLIMYLAKILLLPNNLTWFDTKSICAFGYKYCQTILTTTREVQKKGPNMFQEQFPKVSWWCGRPDSRVCIYMERGRERESDYESMNIHIYTIHAHTITYNIYFCFFFPYCLPITCCPIA